MHLSANTLLQGGKYRIVRFISSGGFGCTYEAYHVMLRKRIAIKEFFVKDFCGRDEHTSCVTIETTNKRELVGKLKQKFIDEARSISELEHPGIIRVTDVFEENATAYYAMDYIDGFSLKELVDREGALPESKALEYIRQVADALKYVHAHNRLHLDIKPGNVMIDGSGHAVLIDFGTSKQYDEVNGENTSTLLGHTPGYAPPEQIGNDLVKFTPAADIYALGATLYKLLSGVTPISSNLLISGEKLEPLSGSVSGSTRDAVEKSMKVNRYDRPESVDAFLSLLDARSVDDDEGTVYGDVSSASPVSRPLPERPGWLIPFVFCLLTALCIFGFRECRDIVIGDEDNDTLFADTLAHVDSIFAIPPKDDKPSKSELVKVATTGTINGHAWVDLGLSVKWATMNVGADNPGDYGDYFAWGEVHPKSKYTSETSLTLDKSIGDIIGNSAYDAARYHWGSSWRLPSQKELEELGEKCRWTWTRQDGLAGYKVTGPNGNSIFLPAAGFRLGASTGNVGTNGYYWSGSPYGSNTQNAYDLYFYDALRYVSWDYRHYGQSVRPVSD